MVVRKTVMVRAIQCRMACCFIAVEPPMSMNMQYAGVGWSESTHCLRSPWFGLIQRLGVGMNCPWQPKTLLSSPP